MEIITKGDVADVAPREIGARIIEETLEAAAAEEAARRAAEAPPVSATPEQEATVDEAEAAGALAAESDVSEGEETES